MAAGDLIDFDVIEGQKENIQSLPGGRSAKKLVDAFSPPSALHKLATPTPTDTKNIHDCIRAEFEAEIANLGESDDPLDVFDRYVRWTLDAFPSAQATPQSQLHTLLERATKTFLGSAQYRNDPRYLRLWLHYIQLFADAPRETFVFLSRHGVGEGLALYYEEYAAWLEGVGRWAQAEEVYKLGIERQARPESRLLRKFGEFEQRRAVRQPNPEDDGSPASPALPAVRPALVAKIDPFALSTPRDPQAPRQNAGVGGQTARPAKSKLAIFSDADASAPAMSSREAGSKGWESIGSLAQRKKENVMEPVPWAGETLKAGGKKASGPKLEVFRDKSLSNQLSQSHLVLSPGQHQVIVNPSNGKRERIFVDLRQIYRTPEVAGSELSFEEIWAMNRGWLDRAWDDEPSTSSALADGHDPEGSLSPKLAAQSDVVMLDENGAPLLPRDGKPKKKKVMEVNETQIIKAKLDSPSGPKIKKRGSSEPTMTMHTKAATDDIYEIFNQPMQPAAPPQDDEGEEEADDDDYETDGDYTSGAESTVTTRHASMSEVGDEEEEEEAGEETSDVKSVSEWSDFTARKHIPQLGDGADEEQEQEAIEEAQPSGDQESDLLDLRETDSSESPLDEGEEEVDDEQAPGISTDDEVATPATEDDPQEPDLPPWPRTRTSFIPILPDDYNPPTRPYRDPAEVANNRLPFMTPITERTESSLDIEDAGGSGDPSAKTPSKVDGARGALLEEETYDMSALSSPLREIVNDATPEPKIAQPLLMKPKSSVASSHLTALKAPVPKGPIIKDLQCNPVSDTIRTEILEHVQPPLKSYTGFYDHRHEKYEKGAEIRKFAKAVSKAGRTSIDKTGTLASPVVISFCDGERQYTIRKELGAGAFAPVYLAESAPTRGDDDGASDSPPVAMGKGLFARSHDQRRPLEAIKMEGPPTPWEFYMMRLAHSRLGPQHRATASLSTALEMHLYQDDGFLVLPYHPHGTLLDVVNLFRSEPSGAMDESLAMFFAVELLRTVEALHAKQLLHGDLKPDNCLLRLDSFAELAPQWRADGSGGWAARGLTLIDFGRGIDMRCFAPDTQFIADWRTGAQDCAEMREGRPWTWQIDCHGLAGVLHCLLFGKYIETVRCDAGGLGTQAGRRYKIREGLKRYWQTEIWGRCFDVLLNPGQFVDGEDGRKMPVLRSMRSVREDMERWLEENCERGAGLKALMTKVEVWAKSRR